MPGPAADPVADAIVARIRDLAHAHGTTIHHDTGLAELLVALKIGDQVPIAPFAVDPEWVAFHVTDPSPFFADLGLEPEPLAVGLRRMLGHP